MKKILQIGSVVLAFCLTLIFLINGSFLPEARLFSDADQSIAESADEQTAIAQKKAALFSEKKKKVKGIEKKDSPNLYAEWHNGIRTRDGETRPGYPMNYKFKELLKARNMQSTMELTTAKASADSLDWIERGPGNVTGRVRGLIVDPDDPSHNTWYAGSVGGGVWKTADGGQSWENLTADLPNLATSTLAMAASNTNVIYMGTGEGFGNVDQLDGSGLWKSTDKGATWLQLTSTANNPEFENVMRIIVDPADENVVVAAVAPGFYASSSQTAGIYRSEDGGQTWTKYYTTGIRIEHLIANPENFNTQYATLNGNGVIKSTDGGLSWANASTGIGSVGRQEIAIAPTDTNRLYISAVGGSTGSILYVSDNGAASWSAASELSGGGFNWLGGQGWYDNTIAVNPYDENEVFVGGINIWRINVVNQSGNWRSTTQYITDVYGQFGGNSKGVHPDQHNIVLTKSTFSAGDYLLLNANDGGVSVSEDKGTTFKQTGFGDFSGGGLTSFQTSQFYGVDKAPGIDRYVGGTQDNGSWVSPENPNETSTWIAAPSGDGFQAVWHYGDANKILETSQFNSIYRSLNGGQSWQSVSGGVSGNGPFFTKLAKSKQDPDLVFAVSSSGVFRTENFANSWTMTPMPSGWIGNSSFTHIKISLIKPQVVWAGRDLSSSNPLFVSTDGGLSFSATNVYSQVPMGRISGLETHPTDPNTAFALFSFAEAPKILKTTDLGQTWEDISGFGTNSTSSAGFPDVAVYSLLVMPYNTDIIWAGTEIGIFETTDGGASWAYANNGFPAVGIYEMLIVDDQIVVATHGRGIWSVSPPELAGYTPPPATLSPRLLSANGVGGVINLNVQLLSEFDSTQVVVAGQVEFTLGANVAPFDTTFDVIPQTSGSVDVSLASFKDGELFKSSSTTVQLISLSPPQASYSNNFNSPTSDFIGNGFFLRLPAGFNNRAIHTAHNYSNGVELTYMLTVPIIVANTNALISFDEIAIIEPGEPGSVFGDNDFWDYVIVEGSADRGLTWEYLLDGYDAREYPEWLSAYNNTGSIDSTLYKNRVIDILDTFSPGEEILIRFRLFADAAAVGWGWAIDNLNIQNVVGIAEDGALPQAFTLAQNYPNPFNPSTTISYQLPQNNDVVLKIYNTLGQEVRTLVNERQNAGRYEIVWDGLNSNGAAVASGMYIYKIQSGEFTHQRKMMLVK
ncbi:MAG: T9SS type A sorting domain-containing protein [Calditrichae bacterium]|nr:T9SS type A sorting domain-containing protein [Calditrichia bacterium]